jgi:hypothetical protein
LTIGNTKPSKLEAWIMGDDIEFFGIKVKCKSQSLAALLNSDVTDDVSVVAVRARDALSVIDGDGEPGADEYEAAALTLVPASVPGEDF